MAVREGRWDCQYCGTKGNIGRHKTCQNCGRSRPEGTAFYLPSEEEAAVLDEQLLKIAGAGQDWICEFCGSSNAAGATTCHHCGAAREATGPVQEIKEYELGATPDSGDMTFDEPTARPEQATKETGKKGSQPTIIIAGIVAAIVLLCGGILAAFVIFGGGDVDATVSGFEWQRSIEVEAFQTVVENDWSVPPGGRQLDQRQEIHHYDSILDHYETRQREVQVQVGVETYVCGQRDLGNGFFEDIECSDPIYETQLEEYEEAVYREEPVYQTKYEYEIDKWIVVRTERSSGTDHKPLWPNTDLANKERDGPQSASYVLIFTDNEDEVHTLEVPLEEWQTYEEGQSVTLKMGPFGGLEGVEP
jgi:hypothetical protein